MKKLTTLVIIGLILPLLSPIIGGFDLTKKYTYASEGDMQNLIFQDIIEPSVSSNIYSKSVILWKKANGVASF
jgi:hypothetical protein